MKARKASILRSAARLFNTILTRHRGVLAGRPFLPTRELTTLTLVSIKRRC